MRKGTLLFVTALLLLALLMTGCGVAQAEYDAVVAERDAAKAQVASLQPQVTSLQTDLNELQASLEETQMALDTAKANYEDLKSDVTSIWTALDKKLAAAGMIFSFWSDSLKFEAGLMSMADFEKSTTLFMTRFGGVLDDVGNPQVSKMWEDAFVAAARNDEKGFATKFAAVMDSLTELIEKDVAEINEKLR